MCQDIKPCVWTIGDWDNSSCPPCGSTSATQNRSVSCYTGNDADCSRLITKPDSSRPCPQIPCVWRTGPWMDSEQNVHM